MGNIIEIDGNKSKKKIVEEMARLLLLKDSNDRASERLDCRGDFRASAASGRQQAGMRRGLRSRRLARRRSDRQLMESRRNLMLCDLSIR